MENTEQVDKETLDGYAKNLNAFCDEQLPLLRKQEELVRLQHNIDLYILNRKKLKLGLAEFDAAEKDAKAAADAGQIKK